MGLIENNDLQKSLTTWPGMIDSYRVSHQFNYDHIFHNVFPMMKKNFAFRNSKVDLGLGDLGESKFVVDQLDLLRNREFESVLEIRRLNAEGVLNQAKQLECIKKSYWLLSKRN